MASLSLSKKKHHYILVGVQTMTEAKESDPDATLSLIPLLAACYDVSACAGKKVAEIFETGKLDVSFFIFLHIYTHSL